MEYQTNYLINLANSNYSGFHDGVEISYSSNKQKIDWLKEHPEDITKTIAWCYPGTNKFNLIICQNKEEMEKLLNKGFDWRVQKWQRDSATSHV